MFKVSSIKAAQAIVGEGKEPLSPSAFADVLELIEKFGVSEFTKLHDDNQFIGLWGWDAGDKLHLNLRSILPLQLKDHQARVWDAMRHDDAGSVAQLRNSIFGGSWRMVRVVESASDDGQRKVFEAVMAPAGHLMDEQRYVVSRGCHTESIAMLAVCARTIGLATELASVPEAVEKFSLAVSGDASISAAVLDLLPNVAFGHVKRDILEVLAKRSVRDAGWIKEWLIGPHYQAVLQQVGTGNRSWSCRMLHPDEVVSSVPDCAPCNDAAVAMVLATLQAYVRDSASSRRPAA